MGRLRPAPPGVTPALRNTEVAPNARPVSAGEAPGHRSEARTGRGAGGGAVLAPAHRFGGKPHAALAVRVAVRVVVAIEDWHRIYRQSRGRDRQAELSGAKRGTDRPEGALAEHEPLLPQPGQAPLGLMNWWAAALDKRLWHRAEASRAWHPKWDEPPMPR